MAVGSRPTSWGTLRSAVVWHSLRAAIDSLAATSAGSTGGAPGPEAPASAPLRVLDAGGGTGGFAVPLAELGHQITVVDPSPDSLAALERRALDQGVADRVTGVQGDLSTILDVVAPGSVDVVLCHSVLDVVDDVDAALRAVATALRPGGIVSLLVPNRVGVVLARALAGRFDDAATALRDPDGRWGPADATVRRFDVESIQRAVVAVGLDVVEVRGVRVFSDLVPGGLLDAEPSATEALVALEMAASADPALQHVATQLHVVARRPG